MLKDHQIYRASNTKEIYLHNGNAFNVYTEHEKNRKCAVCEAPLLEPTNDSLPFPPPRRMRVWYAGIEPQPGDVFLALISRGGGGVELVVVDRCGQIMQSLALINHMLDRTRGINRKLGFDLDEHGRINV